MGDNYMIQNDQQGQENEQHQRVEKYDYSQPRQANKTISKWSGLIEASHKFDAQFFAISPREAKFLDPQQKMKYN